MSRDVLRRGTLFVDTRTMPQHPQRSNLPRFFLRLGVGLIVFGVLALVLPLFGLQFRQLQKVPGGQFAGVPLVLFGVLSLGWATVATRHPKLVRRATQVAAISFVVLIAGGFALGMALKHGRSSGPRHTPSSGNQTASGPGGARSLPPLPNHRPLAPPAERRPAALANHDTARVGDRRVQQRPEPQPMSTEATPDEDDAPARTNTAHEWSIVVENSLSIRQRMHVAQALREQAPSGVFFMLQPDGESSVLTVRPRIDTDDLEELLSPIGEHDLDRVKSSGRITLDLLSPDSPLRHPQQWIIRVSSLNMDRRAQSAIRHELLRELPVKDWRIDFEESEDTLTLIVQPVEEISVLRSALRPHGTVELDPDTRTGTLRLTR